MHYPSASGSRCERIPAAEAAARPALQIHRTSLYYPPAAADPGDHRAGLDSGPDRLVLHLGLRIRELLQPDAHAVIG
ncbi:hypothetical protein ACH4CE_31425 [Streptomyces gelaticus]|uniref:hypothetical protein n=1 Tax=Streptomyces gelaticus TaxID=285446 RepID=UPI0037AAE52F